MGERPMKHAEARVLVSAAFIAAIGRPGSLTELQFLQAIGWLETNYGASWHGSGIGSFNMGAIQRGNWPGSFFEYTDTHPNADGTSTPYKIGFRKYASAQAGFADLAAVVYLAFDRRRRVLPAATAGHVLEFSTELHRYPCYYEGFGATDADRIAHHAAAVTNAIKLQCAELDEAFPVSEMPAPVIPALFIGCTGEAVRAWQRVVGVAQDGSFGGATQTATRAWQTAHGLPPNGVVQQQDLIFAGLMPEGQS